MFCPNCESENHGESRFCIKCASLLPVEAPTYDSRIGKGITSDFGTAATVQGDEGTAPQAANAGDKAPLGFYAKAVSFADEDFTISNSDYIEFGLPDESSDAILWPPETVFVPSSDEGQDEEGATEYWGPAEAVFEDEEADDVFEQSLSGLVLADLAVSDPLENSPFIHPEPEEAPATEINEQASEEVAAPTVDEEPEKPFAEIGPAPDRYQWGKVLLRIGGISLIVLAAFAAGVGAGAWFFATPAVDIPKPAEVPAPETESRQPSSPPGMAYVPGGEFIMGSDTGDEFSRPAHSVAVAPFFIDLTEVTNEDYNKFVNATGHNPPLGWENGTYPDGKGKFPVTGVTWYDAAEYAEWAGKRLPTEEEWEFAARGTDGRIYPWGNEWDPRLANAHNRSGSVRNVGEGERSPFGLFDMSGNAWEWTASDARSFSGGKEFPKSRLHLKIIRGGNWQSDSRTATAVFRGYYGAAGEPEYNGTSFRCVRDLMRD